MAIAEVPTPAVSPPTALRFWQQLQWQLIVSFVCLAILPVSIVVALTLMQMSTQAQQQAFNQLESVTELKQNQLTRWLNDSVLALSFLLSEPVTGSVVALAADPTPDPTEQAALNRLLQTTLTSAAQNDTPGNGGTSTTHFELLFVYNTEGAVIAASDEIEVGKLVNRQPYFAASLDGVHIQPPYYAVGSQALTMLVTQPLVQDGQTVAVLAGQLDLATLGEIMLERSGLGESGETYLVSLNNSYLLTPSRFEGYPLNRSYRSEGITQVLQQNNSAGIYDNYRNPPVQVLGVYRWIPQLQAGLMAEVTVTEALSGAMQVRNTSIGLALAAVLVAVLLGVYSASRVSRPILTLTHAATRLGAGTLDQRVQIGQRNEIGVLATVFNGMASSLQQVQVGLEERVAERTAALEQALREQETTLDELRETMRARDLLNATVRELSSPVLPIMDGVLVMPLIGVIDTERAAMIMEAMLEAIAQQRAQIVIIDVTGVPLVDTQVAAALLETATAARLLGTQTILVGLRPELAQTIVGLGVDLSGFITRADLQSGVAYAIAQQRKRVSSRNGNGSHYAEQALD